MTNSLPLRPLKWLKGEFGIVHCTTPVAIYSILDNPDPGKPFIVNYGGRHPKEVASISEGMQWAENTHYPAKMANWVYSLKEIAID